MTLTLKPKTVLQKKGRIMLKSPGWYLRETVGQEGIQSDHYAESMINFDSEVTSSHLQVVQSYLDFATNTLVIEYASPTDLTEPLQLQVSSFNNPVDMSKKIGF